MIIGLLTGLVVGAIFAVTRAPIPAPKDLAGVVGIAGIVVGYWLVMRFR